MHGSRVALTYDEQLDESAVPSSSDFEVTVAGDDRTVVQVRVSGNSVILRLTSPVTAGETVRVSYTPGLDPIQDEVGNAVEGLTDQRADPPLVTIQAKEGSEMVTEGDPAEFTLTRGPPTEASLTVNLEVTETRSMIETSGGYEPPEEVEFRTGQETATLEVLTDDDDVAESTSRVTARLQPGAEYRLGSASTRSARVTVQDNEVSAPPPPPPPPPPPASAATATTSSSTSSPTATAATTRAGSNGAYSALEPPGRGRGR